MNGRPATGNLGCFGIVSILCLSLFSIGEGVLAWRLNASWFDRVAFWRAPVVHAEPASADAAESKAARERWVAELPPEQPRKLRPDPTKPVLSPDARVSADYTPTAGAVAKDPGNGATVQIPPGALGQAAKVSLTPALRVPSTMIGPIAGPVYEVKIDDRDHTDFNRPIEVSLPYVKGLVPGDQVVIGVWENDRWVALPSTIDPARGMVTATSRHASMFSVASAARIAARIGFTAGAAKGMLVLGVVLAGVENDTTRSAIFAAWYGRSEEYETPEGNFKVHYYTYGSAKVPRDWEVLNNPFTPKDGEDRAPLYVRRIGHWLEFARKELHEEGFALPPARLIRYDCFLVPVGASGLDLGESNMGGPLFISSRIQEAAQADGADPESVMKATCVHELLHVAQGKHYGTVKSEIGWITVEPLCEADAEYNSWRFWRKRDMADAFHVSKYLLPTRGLPVKPLDKADEVDRYAYSIFFEWMQVRFGEETARAFLLETHKGGDGKLSSMDAAARTVLGPRGLPDLASAFQEFAADYYHRDWWNATLLPKGVQTNALSTGIVSYFDGGFTGGKNAISEFYAASRKTQNGSLVRNPFRQLQKQALPHLTCAALYVGTELVAPDADQPQPKLVVEAESASSPSLQVSVAAGTVSSAFGPAPASGSPGTIDAIALNGGKGQKIVPSFGGKGGPNFVTILVANRSLDADLGGITIRRWMLEPPSYGQLEPQLGNKDKWTLKWQPALLEANREVFGTYRVFRRRHGAPRESKVLVQDVASASASAEICQTELTGADIGEHTYSIAVVDSRGNESDLRDADLVDPFVGTWEGQFTLVEGSFHKPIMEAARKASEKHDAERRANIARIQDPGERARSLRNHETEKKQLDELSKLVGDFLSGAEQAARMGVPIQLKIRFADGKYMAHISEVVWGMVPLDNSQKTEFEMKRIGKDALGVQGLPPEVPPLVFKLHRMDPKGVKPNVLREDRYVLETEGETAKHVPIRCVLRWDFERISKEASAPGK